jgi:hypothetical protein
MPVIPKKLYLTAIFALIFATASGGYILRSINPCDHLIALTVLATLATFLISICLRQMGRYKQPGVRRYLLACMLIAMATLFVDFRYVSHHRDGCDMRQMLQRQGPLAWH